MFQKDQAAPTLTQIHSLFAKRLLLCQRNQSITWFSISKAAINNWEEGPRGKYKNSRSSTRIRNGFGWNLERSVQVERSWEKILLALFSKNIEWPAHPRNQGGTTVTAPLKLCNTASGRRHCASSSQNWTQVPEVIRVSIQPQIRLRILIHKAARCHLLSLPCTGDVSGHVGPPFPESSAPTERYFKPTGLMESLGQPTQAKCTGWEEQILKIEYD